MIDIESGVIRLTDELVIFPNYSYEQFRKTKFYNNQDGIRVIYLEEMQLIDNRSYMVSLFFKDYKIYIVSLICCDKDFSSMEEEKRKRFHDSILEEYDIGQKRKFSWGEITSNYDARSNISSIDIVYF